MRAARIIDLTPAGELNGRHERKAGLTGGFVPAGSRSPRWIISRAWQLSKRRPWLGPASRVLRLQQSAMASGFNRVKDLPSNEISAGGRAFVARNNP